MLEQGCSLDGSCHRTTHVDARCRYLVGALCGYLDSDPDPAEDVLSV